MENIDEFEHIICIDPERRLGEQVGNYRLTGWLGRGAFADVYLGEHIYLKRQSAIKMLHVHLPEKAVKAFLNEACTIARLDHPHIVRVLDYGVENGTPFLVMDYAPNGSLRQRFPEGMRVPLEQIVPLVQQMASALDYAHQQQLIHRDVKPENILLGAQDQALLSDFGLVLVAQSMHTQAATAITGTILYMAPEMLEGKVHFASDQYALGIMTYQWLCGECPFTGSTIQIGTQHVLAPPPSLCERVLGLSPSMEQVVFRALAKDRAQRYENVTAFANALRDASKDDSSIDDDVSILKLSFLSSERLLEPDEIPTSLEPILPTQPLRRPSKSWRIMLVLLVVAAVLAASVRFWYNITSSRVSTHSTASPTIQGFSVMQPTVLASPMTTALYLTPRIVSTPPPKATPQVILTPPSVVLHIRAIDDSVQGTGTDQFNYVGNGWQHCTGGCGGNPPNAYDGSNSWDNTINDDVTIAFNGTQIKFYGVVGPPHGIGAISIDGGSETTLDFYSPTEAGNTLLYTSPVLASGQHILKVRVTGNQNSQATWNGINPDRVDIIS
ncbi:MAG TPA: serine/threonine-protein kinase [Ktedonobacteraceae bacterium]